MEIIYMYFHVCQTALGAPIMCGNVFSLCAQEKNNFNNVGYGYVPQRVFKNFNGKFIKDLRRRKYLSAKTNGDFKITFS